MPWQRLDDLTPAARATEAVTSAAVDQHMEVVNDARRLAAALAATLDECGHMETCFAHRPDLECGDRVCRLVRETVAWARDRGYLPAEPV